MYPDPAAFWATAGVLAFVALLAWSLTRGLPCDCIDCRTERRAGVVGRGLPLFVRGSTRHAKRCGSCGADVSRTTRVYWQDGSVQCLGCYAEGGR